MATPVTSTHFRLLMPEAVWLEPEQFEQAKLISERAMGKARSETIDERAANEAHQWQIYLEALAQQGLQQWLKERMPDRSICPIFDFAAVCFLKVDEFRLYLITTEHLLDEVVSVPETVVGQADFYVVIEVSEERAQVTLRGFLRDDQLMHCLQSFRSQSGFYPLPLALFDDEPNHLLFHCRFLEPTRSAVQAERLTEFLESLRGTRVKLSQWLQGVFGQEWQAIDSLFNPEAGLSLRSVTERQKRGKLIDLGMKLGNETIALLVNVAADSDQKLGVLVQVHPTNGKRYLPPDLKLMLLSKAGKVLQETTARHQDNYIQLKQFKGEPGKQFSVQVSLQDARFTEEFEL